jgi:hypothetical protein
MDPNFDLYTPHVNKNDDNYTSMLGTNIPKQNYNPKEVTEDDIEVHNDKNMQDELYTKTKRNIDRSDKMIDINDESYILRNMHNNDFSSDEFINELNDHVHDGSDWLNNNDDNGGDFGTSDPVDNTSADHLNILPSNQSNQPNNNNNQQTNLLDKCKQILSDYKNKPIFFSGKESIMNYKKAIVDVCIGFAIVLLIPFVLSGLSKTSHTIDKNLYSPKIIFFVGFGLLISRSLVDLIFYNGRIDHMTEHVLSLLVYFSFVSLSYYFHKLNILAVVSSLLIAVLLVILFGKQ